jgi:hypothetical protein
LTELQVLFLNEDNELSGTVPSEICTLTSLGPASGPASVTRGHCTLIAKKFPVRNPVSAIAQRTSY